MDPSILGVGIFRKRRASMEPVDPPPPPKTPPPRMSPSKAAPAPYDTPLADGRSALLELPDEVLVQVFSNLPLADLSQSFRLCKQINEVLTDSAAITLQVTLLANRLSINPNAVRARPDLLAQRPLTSAEMLATLRDKLERFRTVSPASTAVVRLKEGEGSLYEYLEGVLLRTKDGVGRKSNELAVYDLREGDTSMAQKAGRGEGEEKVVVVEEEEEEEVEVVDHDEALADADGWTDIESVAANELDVRREHRFGFAIYELAVDPGQDLLILVELKNSGRVTAPSSNIFANTGGRPIFNMSLHLYSLSTFEPHPLAAQPILDVPLDLYRQQIYLDFQICDDGLFVMSRKNRGVRDTLVGFQWTSGRVVMALQAAPTQSFTSFVLLSPSSFVIPTIVQRIDASLGRITDLQDVSDITFTYTLDLYTFPSFALLPVEELPRTPHIPTLCTMVKLPDFDYDLINNVAPPMTAIRTDPPPRHQYASYPLHAPPPFRPDPESGIAVIEIHTGTVDVHYVMIMQKEALLSRLPAHQPPAGTKPTEVEWDAFSPEVRVFGPDIDEAAWVCYVYQNRYVMMIEDEEDEDANELLVYDFDPIHVRRERLNRLRENPELSDEELEGEHDGVALVLTETLITAPEGVRHDLHCGGKLPYLVVRKPASDSNVALIDSERILTMTHERVSRSEEEMVEVWQM